jgi:hypothetical protein
MAAADIPDLMNFEYYFEAAAAAFLATDTGISCNTTLSEETIVYPRLAVSFEVGAANEPITFRSSTDATLDYKSYEGTLIVRVITDNAVGQVANHATYRKKVRASLRPHGSNFNGTGSAAPVTLTGTVDLTASSTAVTGSGTSFTTELSAGDAITVAGGSFFVSAITDNTNLTLTTAPTSTVTGSTFTRSYSASAGPNLPYYDVKYLQPVATSYEVDEDLNVSTLEYAIIFGIRDDAWP